MSVYLLKPSELSLKGGNRKSFEKILFQNMQKVFSKIDEKIKIRTTEGRYYISAPDDKCPLVENALNHLIGISGWAKTVILPKIETDVTAAAIEEGKKIFASGAKTFKIDARRTDKSFPITSYELCCKAGDAVLNAVPQLKVNIHKPDDTIKIEIREKAYIYSGGTKGLCGLPVGTAGKGLLLLSGGIDSPVAGFMMACRGMSISAIHFHAYPYTSQEAKEKVISIAKIIGSYNIGLKLYILNFTKVQMQIKQHSPVPWTTVLLRMAMMEASEKAALKIKSKCLITGESLSQVASQTIENLSCTQSRVLLPVLRPLIGFNKEEIIRKAQQIGTYETSILPYEDCCTLFNPAHPVLYGDPAEASAIYESLELGSLIDEALKDYELVKI